MLCHKLLGISGKVGTWIHTLFSERTQYITANGDSSTLSKVIGSVSQGTFLGPILFIILIGDIIDKTCSHITSFACDTGVILAFRNEDHVKKLQATSKQYKWQQISNM